MANISDSKPNISNTNKIYNGKYFALSGKAYFKWRVSRTALAWIFAGGTGVLNSLSY